MTIPQSHRPGLWYSHWHPTSKKWQKKKPGLWDRGMATDVKKTQSGRPRYGHCRTGQKPECQRPSSIKTSRYWWRTDAGVKIVTFRIAANTMKRNGRGQIQLFNVWCRHQEKKLNSPPSISCHRICGDLESNNFNAGIRPPSIKESFDGQWTPAFRFFTQSASDHTSVSRTGFF